MTFEGPFSSLQSPSLPEKSRSNHVFFSPESRWFAAKSRPNHVPFLGVDWLQNLAGITLPFGPCFNPLEASLPRPESAEQAAFERRNPGSSTGDGRDDPPRTTP